MVDIYGKCEVCNQSLDDGHTCPIPPPETNQVERIAMPRPPTPLAILCDVLNKINSVSIDECNGNFQQLVVSKIFNTGKTVDDLTIRELRELIDDATREFNDHAHGRINATNEHEFYNESPARLFVRWS